jgi:nicotinate-nucleotide--dimethylbenzimidazole phosphoribosyltransferase
VTADLPAEITAAAERIGAPTASSEELPESVTGELRGLLAWWHDVCGTTPPQPSVIAGEQGSWTTASDAMRAGLEAADRAIDAGANVLLPRMVSHDDSPARTVIAVLARQDAPALVPQPEGFTDAAWMAKVTKVRDAAHHASDLRAEPVDLLDDTGALEVAFIVGVLLGAAARETPCVVDGTDELAAVLVADRISLSAKQWWRCGSQSTDPARAAAAERADVDRGLPLALTDDAGLGAESTLALLRMLTSESDEAAG